VVGADRRTRDVAVTLDRVFRTMILRRSVDGVRHILDALLVTPHQGQAHGGFAPGTRVRIARGPQAGRSGTVVGAAWRPTGPPIGYEVRADSDSDLGADPAALSLEAGDLEHPAGH
jgi:hypothetical protein